MTSRRLSRRALLRSAGGLAIALPLLEQMMPARSMAAALAPTKRFLGVFFPSGFIPSGWKPATTGKGYALTPTLQPLAALQDDFLVISGLDKKANDSSHHGGTSGLLTGTSANESTSKLVVDAARPTGRSINQFIADKNRHHDHQAFGPHARHTRALRLRRSLRERFMGRQGHATRRGNRSESAVR